MLYTDEEKISNQPLYQATVDVLSAVSLLRYRGYNPSPKWIRKHILLFEKAHKAAVDEVHLNEIITLLCPKGDVDLGDEVLGKKFLSLFPTTVAEAV